MNRTWVLSGKEKCWGDANIFPQAPQRIELLLTDVGKPKRGTSVRVKVRHLLPC